ncbi:folylpolyglutamate synthase/dihydrofolate synthase family protein [Nocardiopsis ganjiahuensis]|uniref:folylpolyglutamate synthase n=1 Tax=Nocardiopsis ganjiahuensis TaxID=239984 RepID=UPI00047609CD|nr:folylpolyglutamate synthase [Nocardiopsis ganjiahuensis]
MPSLDPVVDPFFSEWANRRPGQNRSLGRAAALLSELDLDPAPVPVLGVVGSKGKGSTATYAAAALSAAGLRTVLVTGPSFRGYRERVRVDGVSVTDDELRALGEAVGAARRDLPEAEGYLAPSGLFLVAGLLHARAIGADVCVLEAGMGGHRDELRLIGPDVVALGMVFAEHVGVLGDTVAEIAREKTRVADPERTRALVTLPQSGEVAPVVAETLAEVTRGRVSPRVVDPATAAEPPADLRPSGLSAASGVLGTAAATRMLELLGRPAAAPDRLRSVLATVDLPARLSRHTVPGSTTEVVVDSAIDRVGVAAALAHARALWGGVDHVLLCLPDHKDVSGAVTALEGVSVTSVRLPEAHLRFEHALPGHWHRTDAESLTPASVTALGGRVLALGTVYFTGRVLEVLDAPTDRLFDAG